MELTLHQEGLSYFTMFSAACTSQESSAESVVPDRMPDVCRLLDTDASVYLRRKRVGAGEVSLEGEIQAAVLFQGEEDAQVFKLSFELPCSFSIPMDGAQEDDRLRARLLITRADARIINPRKLGLTVETKALTELYRQVETTVTTGAEDGELETLVKEECITCAADVSEKSFTVLEECSLPVGRPAIGEIVFARADAVLTEAKTVGSKSILQGSARWELKYLDPEGRPAEERFSVPFSQLIDIPEETDAGVDVILTAESAYAEALPSNGGADSVSLELHLLAQSVCRAHKTMTLLSDAYSIHSDCRVETSELTLISPTEQLTLRAVADTALELPERAAAVLGSTLFTGVPEVVDGAVTMPVRIHALYCTDDGALRGLSRSVTVSFSGVTEANALRFGVPVCPERYLTPSGDHLELRFSVELPAQRMEEMRLSCISRAELTESAAAEEGAPSLIVLRPAGLSMWELARRYHSTVALIEASNPENAEELLLIPRAR